MSVTIKILPDHIVNKIAAGEVVERPASVVKELIENSIDAGATDITIDIEQAGRRLIRIIDNGCGMTKEDAQISFLRHATSKISSDDDLEAIRTLGFRGEALSSIASVSRLRLITAKQGAPSGVMIEIEGGTVTVVSDTAASQGTSLEVSRLFYNTPARLKFLKSATTEFSHILTAVSRQAMANASIHFKLTHNKKSALDLPPSRRLKERTFQLYGSEISENVFEFHDGRDGVEVFGLIGRPAYTRADRTYQDFYVNQRAVKNPTLTHALYGAYGDMLMRNRHPVCFIFIEIDPSLVDVNVHPAKAEVRFRNQSQVYDLVRDVIREALRGRGETVRIESADRVKEAIADFGLRNAKLIFEGPSSLYADTLDSHSELSTPNSALLYPLAQVHDSFIIAQSQDGMAIIDQHAAHERVLFERLQNQFGNGNIPDQRLLIPVQVELGPAQGNLLSEYLPELGKLGFVVEDFGNGAFVIKSIPSLVVGADYKQLLLDVLDEVNSHGKSGKMEELRDGILSAMACHPAIKVHRHLHHQEMVALLNDLFQCRMPHTCPHGRPTIVHFSMDEIKKMFKRL